MLSRNPDDFESLEELDESIDKLRADVLFFDRLDKDDTEKLEKIADTWIHSYYNAKNTEGPTEDRFVERRYYCQSKKNPHDIGDILCETIQWNLKRFPHRIVIAKEQKSKSTTPFYRYRCYRDLECLTRSIVESYKSNNTDELCLYVLAERERTINLYMDMEIDHKYIIKHIHGTNQEWLTKSGVFALRTMLESIYCMDLDRWDGRCIALFQSASKKSEKISGHAHMAVPFADIDEVIMSVRNAAIMRLFAWHTELDLPCIRRLFYRKDDGELYCFVDETVYSPGRVFRLVYNSKRERNTFLMPWHVDGLNYGDGVAKQYTRDQSTDYGMMATITDSLILTSNSVSAWNRATFVTLPDEEQFTYGQSTLEKHFRTLPRISSVNTHMNIETSSCEFGDVSESDESHFEDRLREAIASRHRDLFATPETMYRFDTSEEWTRLIEALVALPLTHRPTATALCILLYGYVQDPINQTTANAIYALARIFDYWSHEPSRFDRFITAVLATRLTCKMPSVLFDRSSPSEADMELAWAEQTKAINSAIGEDRSLTEALGNPLSAEPRQWIRLVDIIVLVWRLESLGDCNQVIQANIWPSVLQQAQRAWRFTESAMPCWTCEYGPKGKEKACPVHSGYATDFTSDRGTVYPQRDAPCNINLIFPQIEK